MTKRIQQNRIILASVSPRRRELLELAGLDFDVIPSNVEENNLAWVAPREHVARLSLDKARDVSGRFPKAWVIAADTIVVIDGEILGKPENRDEAKQMLEKLSGREHRVFTGYVLINKSKGITHGDVVESGVVFKKIYPEEMEWYTGTDEPYDKAGGYAVQGLAACFIKEIKGSFTNVIGLPLFEVLEALKKYGGIKIC